MVDEFKEYLKTGLGLSTANQYILAISGGMDSMCMWSLFRECGLRFSVAHCNFGLRGEESDLDEKFVREFADSDERVLTKKIDTREFAKSKKLSIQMAARELRYSWFEELTDAAGGACLATAHHLDDQVETFFIQLLRRSNFRSLAGIPSSRGFVVRPMMFADREMIEQYVNGNEIPYREDSSNLSDDYLRNRIRHHIIDAFHGISPTFRQDIRTLMSDLGKVAGFIDQYIGKEEARIVRKSGSQMEYDIGEILAVQNAHFFLEELLRKYGFNSSVTSDVWNSLKGPSGKKFYSPEYQLIKDRTALIISPLEPEEQTEIRMDKMQIPGFTWQGLQFDVIGREEAGLMEDDEGTEFFDFQKLGPEIVFRKWKDGDYFYPSGMKGRKKLSDYYIDNKYSIPDKNSQWLMCSGNDICWIVGKRNDERFRITDETNTVLRVKELY